MVGSVVGKGGAYDDGCIPLGGFAVVVRLCSADDGLASLERRLDVVLRCRRTGTYMRSNLLELASGER